MFIADKSIELMNFLQEQFPEKSRTNIKKLLTNRQISINNKIITQHNYPLQPGQKVEITKNKSSKTPKTNLQGIKIIHEDEHLIVINKPEKLLSIATSKEKQLTAHHILNNYVKQQNPKNKIFIVHRLDRETSGLMLFAKSEEIKNTLQENWQSIIKQRSYLALVEGCNPPSPLDRENEEIEATPSQGGGGGFTITSYLYEHPKSLKMHSSQNPKQGEKAVTHYQVLKTNQEYSLLKVDLETGKKNQIRVHMQDIGHPVVGDKKYGSKTNPIGRLGLHAYILVFEHPGTGELLSFEVEMPREFRQIIN